MQQYARNKDGFAYPVVPSKSVLGKLPDDDRSLQDFCPALHMFNVGKDSKGIDIMNCIVGVGSVKLHNLYRYENDSYRFLALISN